ncbi:unnamed protein product [Notodromas monacha]|uniref:Uncharacterized protein n=1 Tax=Notodromas monacha TaxID=399045 RepID=A0A7R9BF97_9CRUS|nr:unnamed protein product [Notodromas monacha]CAG0914323.1 unnamed protein product [Notodromas monacha]
MAQWKAIIWLLIYCIISCCSLSSTEETHPTGYPSIIEFPSNSSAILGDEVILRCTAVGDPAPKIIWHERDTGRLSRRGRVHEIAPNGSLVFSEVDGDQEGWYRCSAKNSLGIVHSPYVKLTVFEPAHITDYPSGYRVDKGANVKLTCVATGNPLPTILWLQDGHQLPNSTWKEEVIRGHLAAHDFYSQSVLTVSLQETTHFSCVARNDLVDRVHETIKNFTVTVDQPEIRAGGMKTLTPPEGYCAPYNGQVCKAKLNGTGLVWYNISYDNTGGWLNEQITGGLWKELIMTLEEPCRSAAEVVLCHYAFPSCQMQKGYPVGLPLCREDCMAVRDLFCYNEWLLIEEEKKVGRVLQTRGHFRMPRCEDLPTYLRPQNVPEDTPWEAPCSHAMLTVMRPELVTTNFVPTGMNIPRELLEEFSAGNV